MPKASHASSALIPTTPLLVTESRDEFNRICDTLNDQIEPRGIIEQMYVEDIAYLVWEIVRLRRGKAAIVNSAFRAALTEIITQLLLKPGDMKYVVQDDAKTLAYEWFSDPNVKKQIADCSENSTWMKQPLKQKPSENQPTTSNGSTDLWPRQKHAATRRWRA
jgi:hypothetical protein